MNLTSKEDAIALKGNWLNTKGINLNDCFHCLTINRAELDSLTENETKPLALHFGLENGNYVALLHPIENNHTFLTGIKEPLPILKLKMSKNETSNALTTDPIRKKYVNAKENPTNMIGWDAAAVWAYNWRQRKNVSGSDLNEFIIPKVDLDNALHQFDGEQGVKVYFGHNGEHYKAVVVGIDSTGKDMVPESISPFVCFDWIHPPYQ